MSKMKHRIVIDYEIDEENNLTASLSEGTPIELSKVLTMGGERLGGAAMCAVLNIYLRLTNREAFLAKFFSEVHAADRELSLIHI